VIRHPISQAELERRIEALRPGWIARASTALASLPAHPTSRDFPPHGTEIKQVYIDLQHSKCCFCEKPLEGAIEQDVEHFRPKAEVKPWPVPLAWKDEGPPAPAERQGKSQPGYAWLAYHPFNYAIACKTCNSTLKKNHFPLAGPRGADGADPAALTSERPLLIYPLGDFDEDPESLMGFIGLSPISRSDRGHARQRALVTIALFRLDQRVQLLKHRAVLLWLLFAELELLHTARSATARARHQTAVDTLTGPEVPFRNCLHCFRELHTTDRDQAAQLAQECQRYLRTKSLGQPSTDRAGKRKANSKKPRGGT
jgi:hypothetical protein